VRTQSLGGVLPDGRQLRWTLVEDDLANARFEFSPGSEGKAEHVQFRLATFTNVDFSGQLFHGFTPAGSSFVGCNFSGTVFETAHLGQAQVQRDMRTPIKPSDPRYPQTLFRDCEFTETLFDEDNFYLGNVRFERCRFRKARLKGMRLLFGGAEWVDCQFMGKVIEVRFSARPSKEGSVRIGRTANEIRGNDFRAAQLYDCPFTGGVDLDAQLLPSGPEYVRLDRARERVGKVGLQVEAWPNEQERIKGLDALDTLLPYSRLGQDDIFMRRTLLGAGLEVPPAVRERVWQLLLEVELDSSSEATESPVKPKSWSRLNRLFGGSRREPEVDVFPLGLPFPNQDRQSLE
jgi:uncharacterized protein YjbI with pentapeptide repeats